MSRKQTANSITTDVAAQGLSHLLDPFKSLAEPFKKKFAPSEVCLFEFLDLCIEKLPLTCTHVTLLLMVFRSPSATMSSIRFTVNSIIFRASWTGCVFWKLILAC